MNQTNIKQLQAQTNANITQICKNYHNNILPVFDTHAEESHFVGVIQKKTPTFNQIFLNVVGKILNKNLGTTLYKNGVYSGFRFFANKILKQTKIPFFRIQKERQKTHLFTKVSLVLMKIKTAIKHKLEIIKLNKRCCHY
jgi:hypothetical protein